MLLRFVYNAALWNNRRHERYLTTSTDVPMKTDQAGNAIAMHYPDPKAAYSMTPHLSQMPIGPTSSVSYPSRMPYRSV